MADGIWLNVGGNQAVMYGAARKLRRGEPYGHDLSLYRANRYLG